MKITVDIECTPHEARTFFGLPNIEPLQDQLLAQLQQQLSSYLKGTDPEAMLKLWLPEGVKGLNQIQEHFWQQIMTGMTAGQNASDGKKD
jgi:Tfp pilus assembly PilM family ATPase